MWSGPSYLPPVFVLVLWFDRSFGLWLLGGHAGAGVVVWGAGGRYLGELWGRGLGCGPGASPRPAAWVSGGRGSRGLCGRSPGFGVEALFGCDCSPGGCRAG